MKCRIISSKSDTKTIIILHKIKFGKLGFSIFLFLGKNLIYSRKIFKSLNLEYPPTSGYLIFCVLYDIKIKKYKLKML